MAVLVEDSAAVTGVFFAAAALGLAHYTSNTVYDAIGSISIGGIVNLWTVLPTIPVLFYWQDPTLWVVPVDRNSQSSNNTPSHQLPSSFSLPDGSGATRGSVAIMS